MEICHRLRHARRRGVALVWVIVALVMLSSALLLAFSAAERARDSIQFQLQFNGQALNIARAGIADALSWFRRQTTQPVTVFSPVRNLAAVPPVNETDDPAIGLVRSVEISAMNRIWARYEVRRTQVRDVTALRGLAGAGTVWEIESVGIIYRNENPALAHDQWPNQVMSSVRVLTELRRLSIVPPGNAAICTSAPSTANFNNRTKVLGGAGIGVVYPPGVGTPSVSGTLQGSPAQSAVNPYRGTVQEIFGISDAELRATADIFTNDPTTIASPLPSYKIVYVDGNITFNSSRSLEGTAILVVNGNLTVAASSNSVFNGLIYCTGNIQINAPTLIRGVVVGGSSINLIGSGDYVEVDYDPDVLGDLLQRLGQYRYAKPMRVVQ